jgi:hypothetical protein
MSTPELLEEYARTNLCKPGSSYMMACDLNATNVRDKISIEKDPRLTNDKSSMYFNIHMKGKGVFDRPKLIFVKQGDSFNPKFFPNHPEYENKYPESQSGPGVALAIKDSDECKALDAIWDFIVDHLLENGHNTKKRKAFYKKQRSRDIFYDPDSHAFNPFLKESVEKESDDGKTYMTNRYFRVKLSKFSIPQVMDEHGQFVANSGDLSDDERLEQRYLALAGKTWNLAVVELRTIGFTNGKVSVRRNLEFIRLGKKPSSHVDESTYKTFAAIGEVGDEGETNNPPEINADDTNVASFGDDMNFNVPSAMDPIPDQDDIDSSFSSSHKRKYEDFDIPVSKRQHVE